MADATFSDKDPIIDMEYDANELNNHSYRASKLTACDIGETKQLLSQIKNNTVMLKDKVQLLRNKVDSGELNTKQGISFLDVKNQLLGQYNLDISTLVQAKVQGRSIENHPTIERLIQLRTYLERVRPIERKLKYQIEKLIKIAASGGLSNDDPLHLKPNPDNMVTKFEEEPSESSDSEEDAMEGIDSSNKQFGIYKPPMMSAAYFEEEVTKKAREEAMLARAKKRALSTAMMRELRAEYSEAPEEVYDDMNLHRFKQSKEERHRTNYEEANFKRLMLTKDEKKRQKQLQTIGTLGQLTKFGDISALTATSAEYGGKKRKTKSKGKSGAKRKKKFRK